MQMNAQERQKLIQACSKLNAMSLGDNERDHIEADDVLCEFLRDVGYGDLAEAFEAARDRCEFWYA